MAIKNYYNFFFKKIEKKPDHVHSATAPRTRKSFPKDPLSGCIFERRSSSSDQSFGSPCTGLC